MIFFTLTSVIENIENRIIYHILQSELSYEPYRLKYSGFTVFTIINSLKFLIILPTSNLSYIIWKFIFIFLQIYLTYTICIIEKTKKILIFKKRVHLARIFIHGIFGQNHEGHWKVRNQGVETSYVKVRPIIGFQ